MDSIRVGLALVVPWLAGALCIRAAWRGVAPAGIWPVALGYGYVLGLLVVTLLLRLQAALGLRLDFTAPLLVMAVLALAGAWQLGRQGSGAAPWASIITTWRRQSAGQWLLFALLLAWLGWRFALLAQEISLRPLYPWDAWTTWMVRPRVWAELHALVPFVDAARWLADPAGVAYTIDAWTYPYTVPLLALWPTLAFGAWNEAAANLPWLGAALALGLGFYGQARLWGALPLTALLYTWLLLSLPLLNAHVALAGYADLWMMACFSLAMIAGLQWAREGGRWQGGLALVLALAGPWVKLEGAVWLLLFIPVVLAARLRWPWFLATLGMLTALGVVWWLAGGVVFTVPGLGEWVLRPDLIQIPYLGRFALGYRGGWDPVVKNFLLLANWHLFWYLMLVALGVSVVTLPRQRAERWRWAGLAFVSASLLALFVLFFMTDAQLWAEQYTSINRVFLDFVPALLFWALTVFMSPRPASGSEAADTLS